jgi:hypothetical protein
MGDIGRVTITFTAIVVAALFFFSFNKSPLFFFSLSYSPSLNLVLFVAAL